MTTLTRPRTPLTTRVAALAAAATAQAASAQWTPPNWTTERLGLYGPEYTSTAGGQVSIFQTSNAAGRAIGISRRFSGAADYGQSAWTWNLPDSTVRIGLLDGPEFTRPDGYHWSQALRLNSAGQIAGTTELAIGNMSGGLAAWQWDPAAGATRIGLVSGPEFTAPSGRQLSSVVHLSESGRVTGSSRRYNGEQEIGEAAWTWAAGSGTTRIGLHTGPEFTGDGGLQHSSAERINAAGRIAGRSDMYSGGMYSGLAAWTWAPGSGTQRIGLFAAPQYQSSGGNQNSYATSLGTSGHIIGESAIYNGATDSVGSASWVWDPSAGTVRTGLFEGPEFTGPGGRQMSFNTKLSNTGRATGTSERYVGSANAGFAAWTWDPAGGNQRIGLTGPEFTRADGAQSSTPSRLNDAGRIAGQSTRFAGAAQSGTASWTWDTSSGTVRTGLHADPEFTRADGYQRSLTEALSTTGRITGASDRFVAGVAAGTVTWTWDAAGGTVRTGLFDGPEFTGPAGQQTSANTALTDSGRITGTSARFTPSGTDGGAATWTWAAGAGTVRTGLTDAMHTSGAGAASSTNLFVSESGYVVGQSTRSGGGAPGSLGLSGWFFDPATASTTELVFSTSPTGHARTQPTLLTESGWVLGLYDTYAGESATPSAFVWSSTRGFSDLGALVDGGLSGAGIASLSSILGVVDTQAILVRGLPLGAPAGSSGIYAFVIPAPGAATLFAVAGLLGRQRRRR